MLLPLNNNSNVLFDDPSRNEHPESAVYVDLRTDAACRLVTGRPSSSGKAAIIGLLGFADRLRLIWSAAKRGDPYADWWLIKVEAAAESATTVIQTQQSSARERLRDFDALGVDLTRRGQVRRIDLLFACPYAYGGARLVQRTDTLIVTLDVAVQLGAIRSIDATTMRRQCERTLRGLFCSAQGYWDFGICRDRIRQGAPEAMDARAKMGVLPDEILNGHRRPRLLAQIPRVNAGAGANG